MIAGIAAGLALTWASVFLAHFGTVRNGPWATSLAVGSAQSGPYLRAYVAVHGLLALNRGETIYYNAVAATAAANACAAIAITSFGAAILRRAGGASRPMVKTIF